jgi:UDP-N-acetylmuramoylalanine--D-glutamate ligase
VETVVASPGLALRDPFLRQALERGIEVVGDIEVFARELRREAKARVIGVTGTNGKSTVTALACEMARAAGLTAQAVGNIGEPVLDAFDAPGASATQVWVVELSSYQLETTASLRCDAATVLNVTQDHLDRYDTMADYAAAKARIFMDCHSGVLNRDDATTMAMAGNVAEVLTFGLDEPANRLEWGVDRERTCLLRGPLELLRLREIGIPGLHNAANALAAHALGSAIGLEPEPMARAIREFRGLPHRVQLVAESGGVRFYDDSKGTNVGASVAALEGFSSPVVLIAGGDGKGQDFSPLVPAVKARARAVVLIGRDAEVVASALGEAGVPMERAASMEEAVLAAHALAKPGDAVLLSPRARASTCSATTATAATCSPPPPRPGPGSGPTVLLPAPGCWLLMLYNPARRESSLDQALLWSALLLGAMGLVMVYSASVAMADAERFTGSVRATSSCGTAPTSCSASWWRRRSSRCRFGCGRRASPWLFAFGVCCSCWC